MRQDISAPDLAIIMGQFFKSDPLVEIENVDGTWIDVSSRLVAAEITDDVDFKTVSVVLTFSRDSGDANTASLSPLMSESTLNVDDSDVYAPLITAGRRFRFKVACVAIASSFGGATYYEMVTGRIDKPSFSSNQMTVEARDLGGLLIDSIATVDTRYGTEDEPVPAADAAQQYLDDNIGADAPTLVDISGTDYVTTKFIQVNVPVMEGLGHLATKAGGLVIRYKYDEDGVAQLTMFDPLRSNDEPAVTLTPSRYIEIPQAAIDATNVRNIIRGEYLDPVTGELARITPDPSDTDSIAAFGPRFMQLGAEVFEGLTGNEVLTVLQSALADLALPKFDHEVTRLGFWPVEIGDVIEWAPNGTTYDETQTLAVVGYTHRFERGTFRTTFRCRGTPAGAYLDWIRRQGTGPTGPTAPPAPRLRFFLGEASQFGRPTTQVDGAIWLGYTLLPGVDEMRVHVLLGDSQDLNVPDIDNTTLAVTVRRPEGDLAKTGVIEQVGEYSSMVLLSTRPQMFKKALIYAVRGGLTSRPVISRGVQAVDPDHNPLEGTIASMVVERSGGTNTITITPGVIETDPLKNGNWIFLERNRHILPGRYIQGDTTPVVFVDSGLDATVAKDYVYRCFVWNGGLTGPIYGDIATGPTAEPPVFADGTPRAVVHNNDPKIQVSWTAATPGATTVRVEASLDNDNVRIVGSGDLASGTVYDTNTGYKFYRLVAMNGSTPVAYSEWKPSAAIPPGVANPSATPVFINGTPKAVPVITSVIPPAAEARLAISWQCSTPQTQMVRIQQSDNGTTGWTTVTDPLGESASVAEGTWRSNSETPALVTRYYRLQAVSAAGTVISSSPATQYVAPA